MNPRVSPAAQRAVRAVRAGAEPGWHACAGLLLLLRDALVALPDAVFAQVVCSLRSLPHN